MALAYLKEFRKAGYHRVDTGVAIVWWRDLPEDCEVVIYSQLRDGLEDCRPQEDHEPCSFYGFDGMSVVNMGHADNPLAAIDAAAKITVKPYEVSH